LSVGCLKDNVNAAVYCCFEAGTTINEIQEYLWPSEHRTTKHPEKYRVLENVTSGPGLSLAGTVSTGAHGNGLNNGIMADSVASFQLLTIDKYWGVKCYQMEPTNGITDPFKFTEKYKDYKYSHELIQDDETFDASVVNIGLIGVVYSYVLRTVPGFCLKEERKVYKWGEANRIIQDLYNGKVKDLYSFQIIGSPYAYKLTSKEKEEHRILISILKRAKPPGIGKRPEGFKHIPLESLNNALVNAGEAEPHIVPLVMHFSLMYLAHESIVLDAAEALNTLSGVFTDENVYISTSECAMPLDGAETLFEIFEELCELYDGIRSKNGRQLVNVPIAQRFTCKTNKYMAMEYDRKGPSITIEQSILHRTHDADDTLEQLRATMLDVFNGRPYWELLHDMDSVKLAKLHSENTRARFYLAMNYFDPNYIFENVFGEERRKMEKVIQEDIPFDLSARVDVVTIT
jgi:hypothetical protein